VIKIGARHKTIMNMLCWKERLVVYVCVRSSQHSWSTNVKKK
jgi:hypothetical protein